MILFKAVKKWKQKKKTSMTQIHTIFIPSMTLISLCNVTFK